MIVDTTVLIDLMKGSRSAKDFLLGTPQLATTRINVMELLFGAKSKTELNAFLKQLDVLGFEIIEISEEISRVSGELFQKYVLSNGLGVADALIAAAALVLGEKLATHNLKHFKFIKGLDLELPY